VSNGTNQPGALARFVRYIRQTNMATRVPHSSPSRLAAVVLTAVLLGLTFLGVSDASNRAALDNALSQQAVPASMAPSSDARQVYQDQAAAPQSKIQPVSWGIFAGSSPQP